MDYLHDSYSFPADHPQAMLHLQQPVQFSQYPPQPPFDPYYANPYGHADYADFGHHGSMPDDYEEGAENLTRPRLTREQVDVLEAQFQAHPKPNSMVKRQLAQQTKLTLPRVANWFQNRRAKAKQQKKQEEFEITQTLGHLPEDWKSEISLPVRPATASQVETSPHGRRDRSIADTKHVTPHSSPIPIPQSTDPTKEAGWASLQRALNAGSIGRQQRSDQQQELTAMPPPALPRQIQTQKISQATSQESSLSSTAPISAFSDWSGSVTPSTPWTSGHPSEHAPFDFGFEPCDEGSSTGSDQTPTSSHETMPAQGFSIETGDWSGSMHSQLPIQQPPQLRSLDASALHSIPYPQSRRGSTSDELATDFDTFGLQGTPPAPASTYLDPMRRPEAVEIDLAARRKRPRPAALGSAALRSRSYGALSSMSPTLRANSQMPAAHTVRHVKSTGHNLNVRYAGIRKLSSAQRSPLNVGSFAEAEAFKRLMAQQNRFGQTQEESSGQVTPLLSPDMLVNSQLPGQEQHVFPIHELHTSAQYTPQSASTFYSAFASPPTTPFRSEFYMANQTQPLMPPISAPPQYATFPDYTPPYSAGPLTSSSWSDAPLTSPDISNFQLMAHMPSVACPLSQDMATGQYRQFLASPDFKPEQSPTSSDQKKTEFFIHEFPGQKEEHAHVAQQLAQQKPKSYVFTNATPNDY